MSNEWLGIAVHYAAVWVSVLGVAYLVIRSANWFYGDEDSEVRTG